METEELTAEFTLEEPQPLEATFEIPQGGSGGTKDHSQLENRDLPEQHPISAITGLETALNSKQDTLTEEQQSAVNSGITSTKVGNYDNHIANKNNPHEVTKAQVGLENVDNTSDANKPISTATQTALDGKQATITGAATTITTNDLTSNRAVISNNNGKVAVSSVTSTELGYVSGVTSNIQSQIDTLKSRGRFLSLWNCTTGLAQTTPATLPYDYKTGDYFIVGTVGTTNYKPSGSEYTGVASTTVESGTVAVNDTYYYDGTTWVLQVNTERDVAFSSLVGEPNDNANLKSALEGKYDASNPDGFITISDVPSVKTLDTTNTSAQSTNASESLTGTGSVKLHKVSKTGSYNDLNDKPTIPSGTVTSVRVQAGTGLTSSQSSAQTTSLDTTIGIASGYKLPTTSEWDGKESYPTKVTISTASVSLDVEANKTYVLDGSVVTSITLTSCETSYQETTIQITTGSTAPTFTDSAGITWVDGSAPILQTNMKYIILIWDKQGFLKEY